MIQSRRVLPMIAALALSLHGCPSGESECTGPGCEEEGPGPERRCEASTDCAIGFNCQNGACVEAPICSADRQCPMGQRCISGGCFIVDPPDGGQPEPEPAPEPEPEGGCRGCVQESPQGPVCVPGTFDAACGGGGQPCRACGQGQSCDEGVCARTIACGPENCEGCCRGEICEDGGADGACGFGGLQCQRCANGASCQEGECSTPCGPDNCAGCCDDFGECDPFGDLDFACGVNGARCRACGGDQACSGGACIDLGCAETCGGCCSGDVCLGGNAGNACGDNGAFCQDCGPGRLCQGNTCALDPRSRWDVLLLSAVVSATNANGDAWDAFGGNPDPYIQMTTTDGVTSAEARSTTLNDTTSPSWFENVLTNVVAEALLGSLIFRVFDDDTFSDTAMASCSTRLEESFFDGGTLTITCPASGDLTQATIRFQVHRH